MTEKQESILEVIKAETIERKLLALAYLCEGQVIMGELPPAEYADCMIELSRKLGFAVTQANLDRASEKYMVGTE